MRFTAIKTIATTSAALLLVTACGGTEATEPSASPEPTQSTATSATSSVPQLAAGQSDQELTFDFIDALNTWWHAGQEDFQDRVPEGATPEQIAEVAMEVAEEHSDQYADALLVDNFDERRPQYNTSLTSDDLMQVHARHLAQTVDGHRYFEINDNGEMSFHGDVQEGYKLTLTVAQPVRPQPDGSYWIKVHRITDPAQEHVPVDVRQIVAKFETDGEYERLAAMQWP